MEEYATQAGSQPDFVLLKDSDAENKASRIFNLNLNAPKQSATRVERNFKD